MTTFTPSWVLFPSSCCASPILDLFSTASNVVAPAPLLFSPFVTNVGFINPHVSTLFSMFSKYFLCFSFPSIASWFVTSPSVVAQYYYRGMQKAGGQIDVYWDPSAEKDDNDRLANYYRGACCDPCFDFVYGKIGGHRPFSTCHEKFIEVCYNNNQRLTPIRAAREQANCHRFSLKNQIFVFSGLRKILRLLRKGCDKTTTATEADCLLPCSVDAECFGQDSHVPIASAR